ncbi:MAG: UbiX family flavin prenyltransferase [Euryarchaeota archaeon]|nr:UbiX family flavin prenyltransferase [Euryarchaeota archaeon]
MRLLVAITGASGVEYALNFLRRLRELGIEHTCVVSEAAKRIIEIECGAEVPKCRSEDEIHAPSASGSAAPDAMVVIPCSMKTLAAIACGYSGNLITRSADVMLKEGRKLVLVPRETPLSPIHLRNMLTLAEMGAVILPAMPAFYHRPSSIQDLLDFIAGKVLDVLGISHNLYRRWGE